MLAGFILPFLLTSAPVGDAPVIDAAQLALAEQVLVASGNDTRVAAFQQSQNLQDALKAALAKSVPNASPDAIDKAIEVELAYERQALFEENRTLYASRFTAAELNDMLAFYRSPGGKALVAQTPAIIGQKTEFGRSLGAGAIDRLLKSICGEADCSVK